jgi:alkylation response protein AidB-like acyl-CoA dehydrogenase
MDTHFSAEDMAFREEVRQFFQNELSDDLRARLADKKNSKSAQIEWQKTLHQRGWIAPNWPLEHGGTGWTATQKFIYEAERAAADAPNIIPFGVNMVGPVIYTFGNEAQKAKFLPRILSSDDWWCQGYSEPGAGSDLAALKTRAELEGDEYVVNGAKIWTSGAHLADWIFCLVRTDNSGKKQEGISFLLIDMTTPGITINPIIGLDGGHSLNEVEFADVRVPAENLIGEQDKGWTYAKALLQHERTAIAEVSRSMGGLRRTIEFARAEGRLIDDPAFQRRVSDVEIELMALEYTELRVLAALSAGTAPGPESSLLKIKGTELQQRVQELAMEVSGYYQGVLPDADGAIASGHEFGNAARISYMYGRASTVYGGSNEVQKNIISKAVLGL